MPVSLLCTLVEIAGRQNATQSKHRYDETLGLLCRKLTPRLSGKDACSPAPKQMKESPLRRAKMRAWRAKVSSWEKHDSCMSPMDKAAMQYQKASDNREEISSLLRCDDWER